MHFRVLALDATSYQIDFLGKKTRFTTVILQCRQEFLHPYYLAVFFPKEIWVSFTTTTI